ncbi:D-alanyl-D-alanine carboxypeptidase [uncultured Caudovirales phage]|uniref:D-alanyl-D-alanine carboxypeptidase n=1 Tax=uncultured Caudovirales phage TaxID=2100421 RepID=A0A6J5N772_9CAUD|nr:D-alanyl-D-alanine carboxypeptidase [uncultured Caudovirales phage]
MRTKRTIENLGSLNKKAAAKFEPFLFAAEQAMEKKGVKIEVISGYRDGKAQAAIYQVGRTKPGLKGGYGPGNWATKARPWKSWHNYGLAIDLGLFKNGVYLDEKKPAEADKLYAEIGKLAAACGIEWAGNWKSFTESPHFQVTFGKTLAELREKMPAVGYDVNKLI